MRTKSFDNAVSPVVGVMLMLVVTILIAAVVSAFAGGLGGSQTKTPQATVSGVYSMTDGMTISHDGGDTLSAIDLQVYVSPTNVWGPGSEGRTYVINKSVMMTNNKIWSEGQYQAVKKFGPGDQIIISKGNLSVAQEKLYGQGVEKDTTSSAFYNTSAVGNTIVIKFYDTKTGKIFATSAPITIQS